MGHSFKTKLSWTPKGYDKTLTTDLSLSVGDLPTEIRVTRLPNKMDYHAGDTFNPDGIIVHAYYEDGSDYGTVLNSELSYDPMTIGESGTIPTHFEGLNTTHFTGYNKTGRYFGNDCYYNDSINLINRSSSSTLSYYGYDRAWEGTISFTVYNNTLYAYAHEDCSDTVGRQPLVVFDEYGDGHINLYGYWPIGLTKGRWVVAGYTGGMPDPLYVPTSDINPVGIEPTGSAITVIWHRPSDGATLTCPLELNVEPAPEPEPPKPVVPEKVIGGDDVAIPAQAHSGDETITGATYPEAQSVGDDAFNGCTNLETTNIPNAGVIGIRAFANCENLTSITDGSLVITT